jgi:hypothetical protein
MCLPQNTKTHENSSGYDLLMRPVKQDCNQRHKPNGVAVWGSGGTALDADTCVRRGWRSLLCSSYVSNQLEGFWRVNRNKDLIDLGHDLRRQVGKTRKVTFVHVKGHSADEGNDRADLLV